MLSGDIRMIVTGLPHVSWFWICAAQILRSIPCRQICDVDDQYDLDDLDNLDDLYDLYMICVYMIYVI